jgi:hypothetical protein
VAGFGDHHAATSEVLLAAEARHELRAEPARVAVELVLTQGVAGDEVNLVTFPNEAKCDLGR